MEKIGLKDLSDSALRGKRVFVRADFNVPVEDGRITDDTRIRATLPTLRYLGEKGARTVIASHLGRPKGEWRADATLRPVAERLAELLGQPVAFVEDIIGPAAHEAVDQLGEGEFLLLENVRFLAGEETNDRKLSEALASFADAYVNDAFGTAHRAHASTCGVAEAARADGKPAVAGFLMEEELRYLGRALADPDRPFIAILGGAKIAGKIDVIEALLPRVDRLLIGGAMANTFFRALGLQTGTSLVEAERIEMARELIQRAGPKLVLPVDCVVAPAAKEGVPIRTVARDDVPSDTMILDIGPRSIDVFGELIDNARTVLWNGPMGLFEVDAFAVGTLAVAARLAKATAHGVTTIAGGGDTVAALEAAHVTGKLTHVSTGGGASLEFLEGRTLPGVAILDDRAGSNG